MKRTLQLFIIFCLGVITIGYTQSVPMALVNETVKYIDKTDETIEQAWKLSKKALLDRNMQDAKERCKDVIRLAEEAEKLAGSAEKKADEAEKTYQKDSCLAAASEADDAEDYCRQLGYHTHEILIYSKKAMNEEDDNYFKSYMNKVIAYAEESYESVKNAKIELEEALRDAEDCKRTK